MANFIDRLSDQVAKNRDDLRETLRQDASPHEQVMRDLVEKYWNRGLPRVKSTTRRPAYAVDGSRAVRHLANGAYLFVAQALMVGEEEGSRKEQTEADVRILPGATPTPFVERFAELMMHRLEAKLAREHVKEMSPQSVMFLDGALYGQLPQLFTVNVDDGDGEAEARAKKLLNKIVTDILRSYLGLFAACRDKGLWLISIGKTSHQATHSEVWWKDARSKEQVKGELPPEISDSEIIYRWTGKAAGYSTPILLGKRSFSRGSQAVLLTDQEVYNAPAIVSFFLRPSDFDDALRIDLPACCIGRNERIGEIESGEEILLDTPVDMKGVREVLELLLADYGGFEVYNALMYSVDREVRLRQEIMDEVYLSLIQNTLGPDVELRLDRSERRFHS